jgi:hypothetical protein
MDIGSLLWLLAVITAGLAAGQMLGEFLLLGRFQSWFFETGNADLFRKTYLVFRKTRRPNLIFNAVYGVAMLAGIAYLAFLQFTVGIGAFPAIAVVLQWLFILVFIGSGFAKLEGEIFEGNMSKELAGKFLSRNVPNLGIYSLLWCASFCLLVVVKVV